MKTIATLFVLSVALFATSAAAATKPNILYIVADDLGWGDVGWHGSKFRTPNLDRLVQEGVELDRHYVQPVCSPTRTALMSGRWTGRWGPQVLGPTNLRAFPAGTTTLAVAMKQMGYATAMAGKWHLGSKPEWGPNHYGFDHSYGSLSGAVDPWTHKYRRGVWIDTWHRDGRIYHEEGNATELVAQEIVQRIKTLPEPWFVYVPFHAVHIPIDAPDEFKKPWLDTKFDDDPATNDGLQRFAAFVGQMDAKVGEFVATVDARGVRERTLIVFHSDNGGLLGGGNAYVGKVAGTPKISSNLPLRGQKAQLYEGGVRVPAFANWKGTLAPSKVAVPMHCADWMPTLTKLVGWTKSADVTFDGQDMWPAISGADKSPKQRVIYIPLRKSWAVLDGDWKIIVHSNGNDTIDDKDRAELFNLADDPYEKNDLAKSEPKRVAKMRKLLAELRQDDLDELPADLKGIEG